MIQEVVVDSKSQLLLRGRCLVAVVEVTEERGKILYYSKHTNFGVVLRLLCASIILCLLFLCISPVVLSTVYRCLCLCLFVRLCPYVILTALLQASFNTFLSAAWAFLIATATVGSVVGFYEY